MWVKQCHKPTMSGNGKHTAYKNGDLRAGLLFYQHQANSQIQHHFNHIPRSSSPNATAPRARGDRRAFFSCIASQCPFAHAEGQRRTGRLALVCWLTWCGQTLLQKWQKRWVYYQQKWWVYHGLPSKNLDFT